MTQLVVLLNLNSHMTAFARNGGAVTTHDASNKRNKNIHENSATMGIVIKSRVDKRRAWMG